MKIARVSIVRSQPRLTSIHYSTTTRDGMKPTEATIPLFDTREQGDDQRKGTGTRYTARQLFGMAATRARVLLGGRRAIFPLLLVIIFVVIYNHDHGIKLTAQPEPYDGPLFITRNTTHPVPKEHSPFYGGSSKRPIDVSSDPLPLEASLSARLDAWAAAPGGIYDDGVTPETYLHWNDEECSGLNHQSNIYEIQNGKGEWEALTRDSAFEMRMELIKHMRGYVGSKVLRDAAKLTGRGIVMLAGNADTLKRVTWSLQMLRSFNSKLPVRVYCFPSEMPDANDPIHKELAELGAEISAVKGQIKDVKVKSYFLKAHSMLDAPWAEILYLDSDNFPVRDPEDVFDSPAYKRLGFWAAVDLWKTTAQHGIWAIMGVKCRNEWEMEAGALFIDKRVHTDVLLLSRHMLLNRDTWYHYSDGDKDIFRWALLMLRKRWAVPGRWVGQATLPKPRDSGHWCTVSMMPFDSWGEPLFLHMNIIKRMPDIFNVGPGNSWGRHSQMPLFQNWPATPSTARLGQPLAKPDESHLRGVGDIDCDMLADADEFGTARAPAKEEIRRRAARELGIQAFYHEGYCIGVQYFDPRSDERKAGEKADRESGETYSSIEPDWSDPFDVIDWKYDAHLHDFESKLYAFGFAPILRETV